MSVGQNDVVAFLRSEMSRETGFDQPPSIIETHISIVILAGDKAFKLKRPVAFPYLDLSTPQKRLAACEAELALNRRTAPSLYLGVRKIARQADGSLEWGRAGELVDAVVEMQRFEQNDLFDKMALDGRLTPDLITALAHVIAVFHAGATVAPQADGRSIMAGVLGINDRALRATGLVSTGEADAAAARFEAALRRNAPLLEARAKAGRVRRCHGDLYLRNICLWQGRPTLFDCIEFSEELATIDVLYDLAFLLMDLWHRNLRDLANLVFNRSLDETGDSGGLPLVPFFMAVRAAVRAHVTAAQLATCPPAKAGAMRTEARAYFDLARGLLVPQPPILIAIGGFSGSGKSTLAPSLAADAGTPPGARVLNSDRLRKQMHGAPPEQRLPPTAYRPEISQAVYSQLCGAAAAALGLGQAVIADAVFDREEDREAIRRVAAQAGAEFHGFWLDAPPTVLARRVGERVGGPSDATAEVLRRQLAHGVGDLNWARVSTADGPRQTLLDARGTLTL